MEQLEVTEQSRSTHKNYEQRAKTYGDIRLGLVKHVQTLHYQVASTTCLDELAKLETLSKILCTLAYSKHVGTSGYIRLKNRDIILTIEKIYTFFINRDYSHYVGATKCDICNTNNFPYLLNSILREVYQLIREVGQSLPCDLHQTDMILKELCRKFHYLKITIKHNKNDEAMFAGEEYYEHADSRSPQYEDENYYPICLEYGHEVIIPKKLVHTYSKINKKIYKKTLDDIGNNNQCNICMEDLRGADQLAVLEFCTHVYCAPCFKAWMSASESQ